MISWVPGRLIVVNLISTLNAIIYSYLQEELDTKLETK